MTDMKIAIMDAAERRMQAGGFGGFSFREIAVDVGIKSSSVHYHFPTKEDLAAAVVRRWSERLFKGVEEDIKTEPDPIRVWTRRFRRTAFSKAHMCPCTVLGASSHDLPEPVAMGGQSFLQGMSEKLVEQGLSPANASEFLSTIIGALVLSNALRSTTEYDRATEKLMHGHNAAA